MRKKFDTTKRTIRPLFLFGIFTSVLFVNNPWAEAIERINARAAPYSVADYYSNNYKKGWDYLMKADELSTQKKDSNGCFDKALNYFKKELNQEPTNVYLAYMVTYCQYAKVNDVDVDDKKQVEQCLLDAIEIADKYYKQFKEEDFLDLKVCSFRDLGDYFYRIEKSQENFEKAEYYYGKCLLIYYDNKTVLDSFFKKYPERIKEVEKRLKEIRNMLKDYNLKYYKHSTPDT